MYGFLYLAWQFQAPDRLPNKRAIYRSANGGGYWGSTRKQYKNVVQEHNIYRYENKFSFGTLCDIIGVGQKASNKYFPYISIITPKNTKNYTPKMKKPLDKVAFLML